VMTVMGPGVLSLLLGNGDGSFSGQTDYGPWARYNGQVLAKGDYNGDGRLDLATALTPDAGGPAISVLLGTGDGTLEEQPEQYAMESNPGLATAGDLNGDSRLYLVVALPDSVAVFLNIGDRAPTASAGGPYSGLANQSIHFNGTGSSDPDGDALTFAWDFGDGRTASDPTPEHAYAVEGTFPVTLRVTDTGGLFRADSTTVTVGFEIPVAVFLNSNGTLLEVNAGSGHTKVAIEQTVMPYPSIDVNSLRLTTDSPNSGTVTECAAETKAGTGTIVDTNLNGMPDYRISFATSCVRDLFSGTPNNSNVNIVITGQVQTPSGAAPLRGVKSVMFQMSGSAAPIFTSASPNPFNPETAISYTVKSTGPVTLRIFSIDGRLVRTLKHREMTAAGTHEVSWNGTDDQGQHVSSGIYVVKTNQMLDGGEATAALKLALTK